MREHEQVTIINYVTSSLAHPEIQKITENWRVDSVTIIEMLLDHFREMGIFRVPRFGQPILLRATKHFLLNSPELQKLVDRSKQDELRRQRTEHGE